MSRDEVKKLLGGYATGTLTAEEQQALFEAALEDQELFDTLAREQGLRDLLRDPSAKAELLAALDERPPRGILAWLRRPMVAGLAMAGLAAIGVMVWQGSRKPPAPVLIAENRPQEVPKPEPPAPAAAPPAASPTVRQDASARASTPPVSAPKPVREMAATELKVKQVAQAAADAISEKDQRRDAQAEAVTVAETKSAEQNLPRPAITQQIQVQAAPPSPMNQAMQNQMNSVNAQDQRQENARALFFGAPPVLSGRAAFADSVAEASGGERLRKAEKKAAPQSAGLGGAIAAVAHLGVRCAIVRDGNREVDLLTPLSAGESVKLRFTPNADGFIYVTEGEGAATRMVASGPVRNMVPFETPALKSDAPGQRQFNVSLTRGGLQKGAFLESGATSRANLVETTSDKESATYVVLNSALPQQVVVPVTVTWR